MQHSAISVVDAVAEGEVAIVPVLARVLVVGTLGAEKPVEGSDAQNQKEKGYPNLQKTKQDFLVSSPCLVPQVKMSL